MIKKLLTFLLFFIFLVLFTLSPTKAFAAWACIMENKPPLTTDSTSVNGLTIDTGGAAAQGNEYGISIDPPGPNHTTIHDINDNLYFKPDGSGKINIDKAFDGIGLVGESINNHFKEGSNIFNIFKKGDSSNNGLCDNSTSDNVITVLKATDNSSKYCKATLTSDSSDGKVYPDSIITLKVEFTDPNARGDDNYGHTVRVYDPKNNNIRDWGHPSGCGILHPCTSIITTDLEKGVSISQDNNKSGFQGYDPGIGYKVTIDDSCWKTFDSDTKNNGGGNVSGTCQFCPIGTYISGGNDTPQQPGNPPICKRDGQDVLVSSCDKTGDLPNCSPIYGCYKTLTDINGDSGNPPIRTDVCPPGVDTSSGTCPKIPSGLGVDLLTNMPGLMQKLLGVMLSVVGGIAILLIVISGYRLMATQGNPEKIQVAREQLTAAIVGLLFVIFSLVIIQVIGYDILQLPGFRQ